MRITLAILLVAGLLWSGYWGALSIALDRGLAATLQDGRFAGARTSFSELELRGFPHRFNLEIREPHVAMTALPVAWQTRRLRAEAASYAPHRLALDLTGQHQLQWPGETAQLALERFHARIHVAPIPAVPVRRLDLALRAGALSMMESGQALNVESARLALIHLDGPRYRLVSDAAGLAPEPFVQTGRLEPDLYGTIDRLEIEAELEFDRRLDRLALHSDPPRLQRVRFDQTGMQWGAAGFRLAGAVEIDAAGLANGHVTVQVETWRDLLELARANALFDDGDMAFVGTLMERFAGTADGESRLELPIQIEDNIFRIGMMRFGPFPPVLWDSISGAGQD